MKSRNLVLAVIATTCMSITTGYCDQVKTVELEKASMRYVLSYAALLKAKQDPSKADKIPQRLKKYRECYAQYLKLLNENDLYNPTDIKGKNDPAGNFNKKQKKEGKPKRRWKKVDTSKARENINVTLETSDDIDNAIENVTNVTIPPRGHSSIDLADIDWDPSCEPPEGYTPEEWLQEIQNQIADGLNDYSEELINNYNQMISDYNTILNDPGETQIDLSEDASNLDLIEENIAEQADDESLMTSSNDNSNIIGYTDNNKEEKK